MHLCLDTGATYAEHKIFLIYQAEGTPARRPKALGMDCAPWLCSSLSGHQGASVCLENLRCRAAL